MVTLVWGGGGTQVPPLLLRPFQYFPDCNCGPVVIVLGAILNLQAHSLDWLTHRVDSFMRTGKGNWGVGSWVAMLWAMAASGGGGFWTPTPATLARGGSLFFGVWGHFLNPGFILSILNMHRSGPKICFPHSPQMGGLCALVHRGQKGGAINKRGAFRARVNSNAHGRTRGGHARCGPKGLGVGHAATDNWETPGLREHSIDVAHLFRGRGTTGPYQGTVPEMRQGCGVGMGGVPGSENCKVPNLCTTSARSPLSWSGLGLASFLWLPQAPNESAERISKVGKRQRPMKGATKDQVCFTAIGLDRTCHQHRLSLPRVPRPMLKRLRIFVPLSRSGFVSAGALRQGTRPFSCPAPDACRLVGLGAANLHCGLPTRHQDPL